MNEWIPYKQEFMNEMLKRDGPRKMEELKCCNECGHVTVHINARAA